MSLNCFLYNPMLFSCRVQRSTSQQNYPQLHLFDKETKCGSFNVIFIFYWQKNGVKWKKSDLNDSKFFHISLKTFRVTFLFLVESFEPTNEWFIVVMKSCFLFATYEVFHFMWNVFLAFQAAYLYVKIFWSFVIWNSFTIART